MGNEVSLFRISAAVDQTEGDLWGILQRLIDLRDVALRHDLEWHCTFNQEHSHLGVRDIRHVIEHNQVVFVAESAVEELVEDVTSANDWQAHCFEWSLLESVESSVEGLSLGSEVIVLLIEHSMADSSLLHSWQFVFVETCN